MFEIVHNKKLGSFLNFRGIFHQHLKLMLCQLLKKKSHTHKYIIRQCSCCSSVAKLCLTLGDPKDCSMPGFFVLYYLPEFAHTRVHWVGDAIQPSHHYLSPPSPPALNLSQHQGLFQWVSAKDSQSSGVSAAASVLPMSIQGWFPSGLTDLNFCIPRDSQEASPAPQFKSISSSEVCLIYGSTLRSIRDYWKNHSFDYTDLSFR